VWQIQLVETVHEHKLGELDRLSETGIDVTAVLRADGRTIQLTTTTRLHALGDEVFVIAAYRMLRKIDTDIGRIETIQGQPRDRWQPFRSSTAWG